jgi:tetratricopeptide (TPR) repeat protein
MMSTVVNPIDEPATVLNGVPAAEIRAQLDLILRSRAFIQSHRIRRFLQFVVEESLLGQPHRLKEYLIGLEVFDRREAFDPRVDSIVRVEARRLRYKIEEYYRTEGREDTVRIVLRKGSYVPIFEYRNSAGGANLMPPRRSMEISLFSLINAASGTGSAADEIQRRLAHVLIKEGCFHVVAPFQPNAAPAEAAPEATPAPPVLHSGSPSDYVLDGSIEFREDGFHLLLQLLQTADRSYIWSETTDGRLQDLSCIDQLAQQLVRDLAAPVSEAVTARRQPDRADSGDAYLQGRYHWKLATPDSIRNSIAFFAKAVEADSNYGAAWAALSEALLVSSVFGLLPPSETHERMREAAVRATSLNPSLPEARVALGAVLSLLDWEWAAGEEEMQKSIQLDKSDPMGHIAYGILLACRGEQEPAIAQVERALELDPASLFPNFVLGWLYGVCRRFDEAIAQHTLVSRLATDYGLPHLGLGMACAGKRKFADAIAHLTNATQMKCGSLLHGQMGYCYAMSGRREEALREIEILKERSISGYVSPVSFAAIYSGLGEEETALEYLERAVETRDTSLQLRLLSTEFDNLQNHPRFLELRARIGLPQAGYAHSAG